MLCSRRISAIGTPASPCFKISTIWLSVNRDFRMGISLAPESLRSKCLPKGEAYTGTGTNTIRFSTPVVDPVMAIWSLGQGGAPASFVFTASEPFTIQSGGPSNEFGGSSITQSGNVVNGVEGNGTIRFSGTFSEITWTNPQSEFFYGFTAGVAGGLTPVPEPSTWLLVATVVGVLWLCYGRRLRRWPARRVRLSRNY